MNAARPRGRTVEEAETEDRVVGGVLGKGSARLFQGGADADRVATRRHVDLAEPLGSGVETRPKATGRSSVSRRFKRATEAALAELMARDLSGPDMAVIMIDGLDVACHCVAVALAITTNGTRVGGRPVAGRNREQDRRDCPAGRPGRSGPLRRRWPGGRARAA